jgi:DNA polymerase-3 subunit alpha
MAAASKLGGYSLAQGDLLRRAMGKKDKEKMAMERQNFIEGCGRTNNIAEKKANAIFDLLEKFAGYGFNKSHSAAYGLLSYQTAYLKAHYPVEFMAGLLSNEINNTEKISVFVGECKRMGIPILPPDINRSSLKFTPEENRPEKSGGDTPPLQKKMAIRYGLAAIKNVGEGAMEVSIAERQRDGEFKSLDDFCARLDGRVANRKMLESLIKAGAFDFTGCDRAELFDCIEEALASAAATNRDRISGQVSLFGEDAQAPMKRQRTIKPWTEHEKLTYEKELLGFYVSGHPLDAYVEFFAAKNYQTIASLGEMNDRATFKVAGALTQVEKKFTKKEGKPFAVIWVEDLTGTVEVVVWNEVYTQVCDALATGRVVAVRGTIDSRGETLRAVAQNMKVVGAKQMNRSANGHATTLSSSDAVLLQFSASATADELRTVREILASSPGQRPVHLLFDRAVGDPLRMQAGPELRIDLTNELAQKLARWLIAAKQDRAE